MRRIAAVVAACLLAGSLVASASRNPVGAQAAQPNRILDTRTGVGAPRQRLAPGTVLALPLGEAVAAGARSAALNLTTVDAIAPGFLTIWPCGQIVPGTSIVNFAPGRTSANFAAVGIGAGGVCLASSAAVDVVADLMGTFAGAADFSGATPTRVLDTRSAHSRMTAGEVRHVSLTSAAGYSAGAGGVALNVTAVNPAADGYVEAYPCGSRPNASTVTYRAGDVVPAFTLVPMSSGEVCLYAYSATDVLVDTFGWSSNADGLRLATPGRVFDTRSGFGWPAGAAGPASVVQLRVAGRGGVPNDAADALLTVTAVDGTTDGYVTVWPCDQPRPTASVLNLRRASVGSNLAYVPLASTAGTVCLYAYTPDGSTVDLVADAVGWTPGGPSRTPPPPDPVPTGRFATLPAGSALPSGATCAAEVRPAAEVRSMNATFNATKGTKANTLYPRVDGNFTGTTDQILQWAACKWGIDEDIVRAQIAKESWWDMHTIGDNGESFGLGQVRTTAHATAFVDNNAKNSSAYNLDYTYAVFRSCYEGEMTWLNTVEHVGTYTAGDLWGCLGVWFSGRWHTAPAEGYITAVKDYLAQKIWTTPGFLSYTG